MKTPAGTDCAHYYEDFNRGRELQECRLIEKNPSSKPWQPADCSRCAVPRILQANGNPDLKLEAAVKYGGFLWLNRRVQVTASCAKHRTRVEDPYVGCPQCMRDFKK